MVGLNDLMRKAFSEVSKNMDPKDREKVQAMFRNAGETAEDFLMRMKDMQKEINEQGEKLTKKREEFEKDFPDHVWSPENRRQTRDWFGERSGSDENSHAEEEFSEHIAKKKTNDSQKGTRSARSKMQSILFERGREWLKQKKTKAEAAPDEPFHEKDAKWSVGGSESAKQEQHEKAGGFSWPFHEKLGRLERLKVVTILRTDQGVRILRIRGFPFAYVLDMTSAKDSGRLAYRLGQKFLPHIIEYAMNSTHAHPVGKAAHYGFKWWQGRRR